MFQDVAGVIDFGDTAHTWVVNDVAIAIAYAMLSPLAKYVQLRVVTTPASLLCLLYE